MPCKKLFSLFVALLLIFSMGKGFANHIAGGEFKMKYLSGDTYRLQLRFFRDKNSAAPYNPEPLLVGIYDIVTNERKKIIEMYRTKDEIPKTSNEKCIDNSPVTEVREYESLVTLPSDTFNNTAGYYISWERCCRNENIINIESPETSGFVFYMELPSPYPAGAGGPHFINSSPDLTKPTAEFICAGTPYSINFLGKDADGDELRYRLITPLNGHSNTGNPNGDNSIIEPAPYSEIIWASGYDADNAMHGSPELQIDPNTGTLSIETTELGLYVITILVEEYRGGVKIGEIRRDVQFFTAFCDPARFSAPPSITGTIGSDTVRFSTGETTCLTFDLTDPEFDALDARIVSSPIDISGKGATLSIDSNGTPTKARLCWQPDCSIDTNTLIQIDVIVTDGKGCPETNYDTLHFVAKTKWPANATPAISLLSDPSALNFTMGRESCFNIQISDADSNDLISTRVSSGGVDIIASGATYIQDASNNKNGPITGKLCWTPPCNLSDGQKVDVFFTCSDNNRCPKPNSVNFTTQLTVKNAVNNAPDLQEPAANPSGVYVFTKGVKNCIPFKMDDADGDSLSLNLSATGLDIFGEGATIDTSAGKGHFSGNLCWTPSCDLDTALSITIKARLKEEGVLNCITALDDASTFIIKLKDQDNAAPAFSGFPLVDSLTFEAGHPHCIQFTTNDADNDSINIDIEVLSGIDIFNLNAELSDTVGQGSLTTRICWTPPCDIDTSLVTNLRIIATDFAQDCKIQQRSVTYLQIKTRKPYNRAPELKLVSSREELEFTLGQSSCVLFTANDPDNDTMSVSIISQEYDIFGNGGTLQQKSAGTNLNPELCWAPPCIIDADSLYIKAVVFDRGRTCMTALSDTVNFYLRLKTPTNDKPSIDLISAPPSFNFELGKQACITFESNDADKDSLNVRFYPIIYDIFAKGAKTQTTRGKGKFQSTLCWTPPCNLDTLQNIRIAAVVNDEGRACIKQKADTVTFSMYLKQPINSPPVLSISKPSNSIKATIGKEICFTVYGDDADAADSLKIDASITPDITSLGATFTVGATRSGHTERNFCWTPPCDWDTLTNVKMRLILDDNACAKPYNDTLNLKLDIIPQTNNKPAFLPMTDTAFTVLAGDPVKFNLEGEDADSDYLVMTVKSDGADPGFDTLGRVGNINSVFNWNTTCADVRDKPYTLSYKVQEVGCAKTDTDVQEVTIKVIPNGQYFVPDIFSPNGDGRNDVLKVVVGLEQQRIGKYNFKVFNRWGEILFQADNPEAEWRAEDALEGVYVYVLDSESCPKQQTGLITIKH